MSTGLCESVSQLLMGIGATAFSVQGCPVLADGAHGNLAQGITEI